MGETRERTTVAGLAALLMLVSVPGVGAGNEKNRFTGLWAYQGERLRLEYQIEKVDEDGAVEGAVCTVWDTGEVWVLRLEGFASIAPDGDRLVLDAPGAKHNVRALGEGLLAQVSIARRPEAGVIATLDLKRRRTPKCTHRVRAPGEEVRESAAGSDSLIGEWTLTSGMGSYDELAINKIMGKHVEGRMCSRRWTGNVYIYDLHPGAATKAEYDRRTGVLTVTQTTRRGAEIEYEFWRSTNDRVLRTVTQIRKGKERTKTTGMKRGRHPEGCLAQTNARVPQATVARDGGP